jgi:hypothetical protein
VSSNVHFHIGVNEKHEVHVQPSKAREKYNPALSKMKDYPLGELQSFIMCQRAHYKTELVAGWDLVVGVVPRVIWMMMRKMN